MNRRQLNKLNMYRGVDGLTGDSDHQDAVQKIPAFEREAKAFRALLPQIQQASKRARAMTTGGITETTESLREELATMAACVSSAVVAFAEASGDTELSHGSYVTRSSVVYGRADDGAEICDNLLAVALARVGGLEEYGINRELLDEFDELIQDFSERIGHPRHTINQRKTIRATLPELFAAADQHLAQMDRLANVLNRTHPEFATAYQTSRRIFHIPGTRPEKEETNAANPAKESEKDGATPKTKSKSKAKPKLEPNSNPDAQSTSPRTTQPTEAAANGAEEKGLES
jgi:hypothetical protein